VVVSSEHPGILLRCAGGFKRGVVRVRRARAG
jgi:hypothetical protein